MHKWRPRSGRNADYKKWERSLRELLAAFACTESMLAAGPPQVDSSSHDAMTLRSGEKIERDTTAHELQTAALVEWQSVNTALYWHVKPSLLIDGPDFERDARKTDLYSGRLANGWKLIEWARGHADVSGKTAQKNLRSHLGKKLKEGSTRAQFNVHAMNLYDIWALISGNDASSPESLADYYEELLHSMPTAPEGAHLVGLRTWLACRINDFKHGLAGEFRDVDDAIDAMLAHAKILGVPPGDAQGQGAGLMAAIGIDGEVQLCSMGADGTLVYCTELNCGGCVACDPQEQLNAMGANGGRPSNKPPGSERNDKQRQPAGGNGVRLENDCDYCDAWSCQSRKKRGKCICKHDSTFDLQSPTCKLTSGAKGYVKMARKWHLAHPEAKTLKGVTFRSRPATDADKNKTAGSVAAICTIGELLGSDDTKEDFNKWLEAMDAACPGLSALGDLAPTDEIVIESATGPPAPTCSTPRVSVTAPSPNRVVPCL